MEAGEGGEGDLSELWGGGDVTQEETHREMTGDTMYQWPHSLWRRRHRMR